MTCGEAAPGGAPLPDDLPLPETVGELRTKFGVCASYLQLWRGVIEGRVPAVRVGRQYRIKRADLPTAAEALRAVPVRPRAA